MVSGNGAAMGIYVNDCPQGSEVNISRNKIIVYSGDGQCYGIDVNATHGINIINNIISIQGVTDTTCYGIRCRDMTGKIVNNTIFADSPFSQLAGIHIRSSPVDTNLEIINNIIGLGLYGSTTALYSDSPGSQNYAYNLFFNCQSDTGGSGALTDGGNNLYETSNIFYSNPAYLFTSAYDGDLSDGDSSDYHLNDPTNSYGVDKGTDTNTAAYGNVSQDFEGDSRPQGSAFDRGADEAR